MAHLPSKSPTLLRFSLLKSLAQRAGVESVDRRQGFANIKFHQQSKIDPLRLMQLVRESTGASFSPAGVLKWPLKLHADPTEMMEDLRQMLVALSAEAPVPARS